MSELTDLIVAFADKPKAYLNEISTDQEGVRGSPISRMFENKP